MTSCVQCGESTPTLAKFCLHCGASQSGTDNASESSTTKIFISYGRSDASGHAGRLYDRLSLFFKPDQIFMDVDALKPGEDFAARINDALSECSVFLPIIGRSWIDART